jgi:hypothetical protein
MSSSASGPVASAGGINGCGGGASLGCAAVFALTNALTTSTAAMSGFTRSPSSARGATDLSFVPAWSARVWLDIVRAALVAVAPRASATRLPETHP